MKKVVLFFVVLFSFANVIAQPLEKKVFFTGSVGANVTIAGGLAAFEKRKEINDFISHVQSKGGQANGGVLPRISPLFAYGADIRFSDRFYFEPELALGQKGFTENLYYKLQDTLYNRTEKVKVNYLDMTLAVKYQYKFYFSIYTGVTFGLNLTDRVYTSYQYEIKDAVKINEEKKKYLYEVYKSDRRLYVPSYVLGIGYWHHDALEFRLRLQKTLNVFNEDSPEINFWVIQPTITYVFGKPGDRNRKLYAKGGIK